MSSGNNTVRLPVDVTEEVLDTPELQRFVNYQPKRQALDTGTATRFAGYRQDLEDSVNSPYSGIPSSVGRQRALASGVNNLAATEAQAYNAAFFDNEAFLSNLYEAQAAATRKTRRHGYDSQIRQGGGGIGSALLGAGATIGAAFL